MIERKRNFGRYISLQSIYNVVKAILKRLFGFFGALATWVVNGIDLSKWNGFMNWAVTMLLVDFLYLRGGYGYYGKA